MGLVGEFSAFIFMCCLVFMVGTWNTALALVIGDSILWTGSSSLCYYCLRYVCSISVTEFDGPILTLLLTHKTTEQLNGQWSQIYSSKCSVTFVRLRTKIHPTDGAFLPNPKKQVKLKFKFETKLLKPGKHWKRQHKVKHKMRVGFLQPSTLSVNRLMADGIQDNSQIWCQTHEMTFHIYSFYKITDMNHVHVQPLIPH